MYTKNVTIINNTGLHARPAADFVRVAGKYKSVVQISRVDHPEQKVNAKSIVLVLSLSAGKGTEIIIYADGQDEVEAVNQLTMLIKSGFGEA